MVCEIENSKVMAIFKESRLGYSKKYITLMSRYNHCNFTFETQRSDVLDPVSNFFLQRAPLSTDVPVLLLNHPIVQIGPVLGHIRFEHVSFVVCSYKFVKNCSTFYQPVRIENFLMHITMHFLLKILLCSSA